MKKIRLGEICDLKSGYAFKSSDYVDTSNTLNCRMSNIRPGAIFDINYNIKYLPDEYADKYKEFLLHDDDIIIAMTDLAGDPKILGVPAKVITNGYNILQNQRVGKLIIKEKNKVNFNFLKYALSSPKNKEYYKRFAGGGLQINISNRDILNVQIPLYEIQEQIEISNKLDKVNKLIDIRKKQIEELDRLIKSKFAEMFKKYETEKKVTLGKLSEFVTVGIANSATHAYCNDGIIMFRNQNIKENYLDDSDLIYINEEFANKYYTKKLKENDILVTRTGYPGIACLVPKKYEGTQTFTTLIVRLREDNKINKRYICNFINSDYGKQYVKENQVGVAQQNFGAKALEKMPVILPPIELQNQFEEFVKLIEKQKVEIQKSLEEMQKLQESLMNKYFGE